MQSKSNGKGLIRASSAGLTLVTMAAVLAWPVWAETAAPVAEPPASSQGATSTPSAAQGAEEPKRKSAKDAKPTQGAAAGADPNEWAQQGLQYEDIEGLLKLLPLEQRESVLSDPAAFQDFVKLEAQNRAVVSAARANKIEDDRLVQTLMRRGSERVLAQIYLNQVIRANLPAGFPSEEQTREYYDRNKARFEAPERMPVWQIFLPVPKDAKEAEVAETKKKAEGLAKGLKQGKQDFAAVATEHSRHEPSRINGGFMGLLKVTDLIPEIRLAVTGLKEDTVSAPLKTDAGFHIIKRGAIVPAKQSPYEEIKAEVRQVMLREAVAKIRDAALKKIAETYPVKYDAEKVDDWRDKLRTMEPAADGPRSKPAAAETKQ